MASEDKLDDIYKKLKIILVFAVIFGVVVIFSKDQKQERRPGSKPSKDKYSAIESTKKKVNQFIPAGLSEISESWKISGECAARAELYSSQGRHKMAIKQLEEALPLMQHVLRSYKHYKKTGQYDKWEVDFTPDIKRADKVVRDIQSLLQDEKSKF